jgi:hypothetical protein
MRTCSQIRISWDRNSGTLSKRLSVSLAWGLNTLCAMVCAPPDSDLIGGRGGGP